MISRIKELENKLKLYSYEYHTLDSSTISDYEYDSLYNELLNLYDIYPDLIENDSIVRQVGFKVLDKFQKHTHTYRMYSLNNAFSESDLIEFDNRITKTEKNISYVVEPKIDGLAISITYENGLLVNAVTRGDGVVGEVVTNNVKTIKCIPLKISNQKKIVVRGEIYMKRSSFIDLNKMQEQLKLPLFANARNAAAGSIRQLDSKVCAKRNLSAYFYSIANYKDFDLDTHYDVLQLLKELGFEVNNQCDRFQNIKDAYQHIQVIESKRLINDYDIDGSVVKVDKLSLYEILGFTSKFPRFAIAFKFPAALVTTKVIDIIYTVGRTGQVTPNALLDKVYVDGSNVSKATLHNIEYIKERDIRVGDTVIIRKAGDIIPEVVEVVFEKRNLNSTFSKMIEECPICSSKLRRINESVDFFCVNEFCPAKIIEGIIHFASRKAMNIVGLGERIIEEFYNDGIINDISDIYILEKNEGIILDKEGFGQKSFDNLISSIENSKNNELYRLIFGLGIRHVGEKASKTLVANYHDIDLIINSQYEDLILIDEIGPKIAQSIVSYFKCQSNIELINKLRLHKLKLKEDVKIVNYESFFTDKTVVITGSLLNYKRSELSSQLELLGAKVSSSISKNTNYLICGEKAGSKRQKAIDMGVAIITEEELKNLI